MNKILVSYFFALVFVYNILLIQNSNNYYKVFYVETNFNDVIMNFYESSKLLDLDKYYNYRINIVRNDELKFFLKNAKIYHEKYISEIFAF